MPHKQPKITPQDLHASLFRDENGTIVQKVILADGKVVYIPHKRSKFSEMPKAGSQKRERTPFNPEKVLESVNKKLRHAHISFEKYQQHEGDFTICLLHVFGLPDFTCIKGYAGASRRAHGDTYNSRIGERIAFRRALNNALQDERIRAELKPIRKQPKTKLQETVVSIDCTKLTPVQLLKLQSMLHEIGFLP